VVGPPQLRSLRAAGYDLKSHKTPQEGYCAAWDMKRIVLPEFYQLQAVSWLPWE
jgi:hypothetical protein